MEKIINKINNHLKPNRMGKGEFTDSLIDKKFEQEFKKKYPEYEDLNIINEWLDITDVFEHIICNEPNGFNFSKEIGDFYVRFINKKNIILDKRASSNEGKGVRYLNLSTNRKPGKIVWKSGFDNNPLGYIKYLGFMAIRKNKIKVKDKLKTSGNIFKDVSDKRTR
jgi:hypothetical protein